MAHLRLFSRFIFANSRSLLNRDLPVLCLILFLALFATLSCSKEPPPTSPSPPDNPSSSPPDDPSSSPDNSPSPPDNPSPSPEVAIPDAALRTLIEKVLKKNPKATITQAEMNTLNSLDGRELGIKSLSSLETATNLQELYLSHNQVSDLTPLANLDQLQVLYLPHNQISDLTPLANLDQLAALSLDSNQVSDLTPLANLDQLQLLHLNSNQVSDLTPLANLDQLQILRLNSNQVSDLTPLALANLDQLRHLYLSHNQVSDLTPLANLDQLQVLELSHNQVSDLTPLANLDQLRGLSLNSNQVSDLTPLTALPHLKALHVRANSLSTASIHEHIPSLQRRGVDVDFFPVYAVVPDAVPDTESPFDIELVFLDDFTEAEQELWHLIAKHWEAAIQTELPDYEFSNARIFEYGDHSIRISAGELIDDLRIYITKFDKIDPRGRRVNGYGGPRLLRSSSMPLIGHIGIEQEVSTREQQLWSTGRHEIGHVLGIGTIWEYSRMLRGLNADTHFAGPQAIAAFDQAGGTDYQGAKVPTEQDRIHWRDSVLAGELMGTKGGYALSAITLGALSDLGYSVDLSAADPYDLLPPTAAKPIADAVPFCSLEGLPAPVYVDD